MRMRQLILTCFLSVTTILVCAQSTNIGNVFQSNFKKAEELYKHLAYRNALELYLATIGKDSSNLVARQRIADCYFRLGKLEEAERWYSTIAVQPNASPEYKYQYAQILAGRGNYKEASKWFTQYSNETDDKRALSKIEFFRNINYYSRDSSLYQVQNQSYNSDQSDFAPQYFKDGVVFVSARDREMFVKRQSTSALNENEMMLNIYFAPKNVVEEKDVLLFNDPNLNSPFHDGPIVFYSNNERVAFSRNNLVNGKAVRHDGRVNLGIHFGQLLANNVIGKVEPFPFNDNTYSNAHPSVNEAGTVMFFASNQPGGLGGIDIYISVRDHNQWQKPVNLGASVNTKGDEFYPFLANDSTLYFSSNGHGGFGGLDIYVTTKKNGAWSAPQNLGSPLNNPGDDFSLVMDRNGRQGMFSSNREGGHGYDDIYSFTVKWFSIVGRAIDKLDSSKAIPGANIFITDDEGQWTKEVTSDENGYFFMDVPFDKSFRLFGSGDNYLSIDTTTFSTHGRTLGRDSIDVKLWPKSLLAKGIIYSNESQDKLPDATVVLKNITDGVSDSVSTQQGTYSFELRPNKKYLIRANRPGFIPRQFELNTTGILTGSLVNDLVLEEEFREKFVIQFDFEKWDIKPESYPVLDKVARAMSRDKAYHLHVGAHADSQGTHEFNLTLSNQRAREVVKYLGTRGVGSGRITAIGFGEELLLNKCSNGVICEDNEHAKNRRAELKVQ